jgi:hypothetical protein
MRQLGTWALALLLLTLVGCRDEGTTTRGCQQDEDCGSPASGFRCEQETGVCYCRTDEGCSRRQFCNTAGFCQDRSGCTRSSDCLGSGLFCDTTTGTCLSEGRCSTDLHCRIGQVCDMGRGLCREGCRTAGDCNGTACACDGGPCGCSATTAAELAACPIGVCDPSFCESERFCRFGEKCEVRPDAGEERAQCFSDFDPVRRPYCSTCTWGGGTEVCGRGANYCLVDTRNPGNSYCGVDCSAGQTCPRGYGCKDVIVVQSVWGCSADRPSCQRTNIACQSDSGCPRGSVCAGAEDGGSGFCTGVCRLKEGDPIGFCSCVVDEDCVQETCSAGECTISRKACVNSEDCRPIRCVEFGASRGCLIGQNCAPTEGLSCLEVK